MKFNQPEIENLLSQYVIGELKAIEPLATSGNQSFLIVTATGKYFLRLSGDLHRGRSQEEIEGELDLLDKLKANNFPAINYLKTKTGVLVVTLANHHGYLRKYLAGEFVTGNPSAQQLIEVGKVLGQYHQLVSNYHLEQRKNINFGLAKTIKFFKDHQAEILNSNFKDAKKFVEIFTQEINKLNFPDNLPAGMIHEDLGKRHVLWQGDKIAALLDFDRSYFGPLVLDLGQALRGWCFTDNWQNWNQTNVGIFLEAYGSVRKLNALEKEYLVSAIKFAILERALSFCLRNIYSDQPDQQDEKFALESLLEQLPKILI